MEQKRKIDFRYAPYTAQVCIGLVDDPHKTLVWDDGSICFTYEVKNDPYWYFLLQQSVQSRGVQNRGFRYRYRPYVLHRDDLIGTQQDYGAASEAIVTTTQTFQNSKATWTCFAWQKDRETRIDVVLWQLAADEGFQRTRSGIVLQELGEAVPADKLFATQRLAADGNTALVFLEPGKKMEGAFFIVQSGTFSQTQATLKAAKDALVWCKAYWAQVQPFQTTFTVPDAQVNDMLMACGRNILQAREMKDKVPTYQVGPTCYRGLWIADGLFFLDAVHMMGRSKEAYEGLFEVLRHVHPNGSIWAIPYHEKESAIAIFTFVRQCRLMQDETRFRELWPTVCRAFDYIRCRVAESKTLGEGYPAYGLYPPSYGDGGINGLEPERTTPLWIMAGVQAAAKWGKELSLPEWKPMQGMVTDMMHHYRNAYERDRRQTANGVFYAPISMLTDAEFQEHMEHADFYNKDGEVSNINGYTPQSGTWALAQAIAPGEVFAPDDIIVTDFLNLLDSCDDVEGIPQDSGWMTDDCLWPYASMFHAEAFLYAGNGKKAVDYLYAFANHACKARCWREEQTLRDKNSRAIWGDMPHNWGSAEFIRLCRNLVVLEKGENLELLAGLPAEWLPKDNAPLCFENTPTVYGKVTLRLEKQNDAYVLQYTLTGEKAPKQVMVHCVAMDMEAAVSNMQGVFAVAGNYKTFTAKITPKLY